MGEDGDYATLAVEGKRVDLWIERYLVFLDHEIVRLKAGFIGEHYLHCAEASYREFQSSQAVKDRFRAWLAIRTCCQWLCQLRRCVR